MLPLHNTFSRCGTYRIMETALLLIYQQSIQSKEYKYIFTALKCWFMPRVDWIPNKPCSYIITLSYLISEVSHVQFSIMCRLQALLVLHGLPSPGKVSLSHAVFVLHCLPSPGKVSLSHAVFVLHCLPSPGKVSLSHAVFVLHCLPSPGKVSLSPDLA